MMETLLTTAEVAEKLRMPEATLRYWRALNKGPKGRKVGRRVLYSLVEVEAYWASLEQKP
jgi:hypothetical protein